MWQTKPCGMPHAIQPTLPTHFPRNMKNILKRFVSHTASADSYQLMCDVSVPHTKEYMNLNTSLQSQLSLYTDSSSLIHTAMFSDTKGQLSTPINQDCAMTPFRRRTHMHCPAPPPSAFILPHKVLSAASRTWLSLLTFLPSIRVSGWYC